MDRSFAVLTNVCDPLQKSIFCSELVNALKLNLFKTVGD